MKTTQTHLTEPVAAKPAEHESFIKKQLKLASSTAVVSTVATLSIGFWINLSFIMLFFGLLVAGAASFASTGASYENTLYGQPGARTKLLSLQLSGPIEGASGDSDDLSSLFGATSVVYGYDIKERLLRASREEYAGVILEIDSPGGTIFGSKAVSDGIKQYQDIAKKPVFVHVQGYAASGGYWIAAAADKIYADAGTGVGSIGVIFGPFTYYDDPTAVDGGLLGGGVVTQGGIEEYYVTAGEGKDAGNPFRRLSSKELSIFQESVNDSYDQFVKHVAANRGLDENEIRNNIGAHLYGEQGALERKLIDGIASREQAYNALAKQVGASWGQFQVVGELPGSSSGFGAFAAHLLGTNKPKTQPSSVAPAICSQASSPLVYHGNLMQLCKAQ